MKITNVHVKSFLNNVVKNGNVQLLDEGKEKNELVEIAKKRGVNVKNSKDLGIIKTIWAFADQPNENLAILPEDEILKVLPGIIGKPMNRNHVRDQIRGVYVDYKYIKKSKKIIAYATFFKSCFPEEWEEAKELRKQGRLATSFEIWSPDKDHKYNDDGTYEMHNMEIAGGGLLFNHKDDPIPPAFPGAVVLDIAKKQLPESTLVFAKKYDSVICADLEEKQVVPTDNKRKCSNCGMMLPEIMDDNYKCSSCRAILNREGTMIFPPQDINFRLSCVNKKCGANNWAVESEKDNKAVIQCLACKAKYNITFAKEFKNLIDFPLADAFKMLPNKTYICPQCNTSCGINSVSELKPNNVIVKCRSCGLKFPNDISKNKVRIISNIEVLIAELKKQTEGGEGMEKKVDKVPKEVVEPTQVKEATVEPVIETVEIAEVIETTEEQTVEPVVEATKEDIDKIVTAKFHEAKVSLLKARIRKLIAKAIDFKSKLAVVADYEVELASVKEGNIKSISDKDIEIAKLKEDYEVKLKMYQDNGVTIAQRREELGDFATELSDSDLLNEDKFEKAQLIQAQTIKDETPEDVEEVIVASKKYKSTLAQRAVNRVAFGREE